MDKGRGCQCSTNREKGRRERRKKGRERKKEERRERKGQNRDTRAHTYTLTSKSITEKETQMYRRDFGTLWEKARWDVSREQCQNMYII